MGMLYVGNPARVTECQLGEFPRAPASNAAKLHNERQTHRAGFCGSLHPLGSCELCARLLELHVQLFGTRLCTEQEECGPQLAFECVEVSLEVFHSLGLHGLRADESQKPVAKWLIGAR